LQKEKDIMFRKVVLALTTVAALVTVGVPNAEARGFGGGGFHGGFHGGYRGGGWGRGVGVGVGLGLLGAGLYGAYAYDPAYFGYGYGCFPHRMWTPYGWRVRQVCD
jgi:hypothetical protein